MALFNFSKKKEEKKESTCSCSCGGSCETATPVQESTNACCGKSVEGICCIKVLGSGCKNCHALLKATKEAIQNIGLNIEIEYITDMEKIMEYGAMSMPALVVNEQIASMGKVLKAPEVETLLRRYEK